MLARIKQSEFLRNTATLMSGTVLAQILPIMTSPIMTRIFNPADYGALGLYMAISGMLNVVVTSQYNHAIMLPKEDDESINIIGLCFVISIAVSLAVFVATIAFSRYVGSFFDLKFIEYWLYLVPISVLLSGIYTALNYWTNRNKKYKRLAISRLGQAIVTIIVQISVGLSYKGPAGLLLGLIVGQLTSTAILLAQVWREDQGLFKSSLAFDKIVSTAKARRSFAYYLLPADFINAFNNQIPIFLLTKFTGAAEVGKYNFTQRILGLPSGVISSSLVDVFKQRAISDYNTHGNCREIYVKTFKTLALLGIAPLIIILSAAPDLFGFVFGDKWREAGVYAQILSVMFYLRFVISPLSYIYYIAGRQKEDFLLHIAMALGTVCSLAMGHLLYGSPKYMILFFSMSYSGIYLIYLIRSYTLAKGRTVADF